MGVCEDGPTSAHFRTLPHTSAHFRTLRGGPGAPPNTLQGVGRALPHTSAHFRTLARAPPRPCPAPLLGVPPQAVDIGWGAGAERLSPLCGTLLCPFCPISNISGNFFVLQKNWLQIPFSGFALPRTLTSILSTVLRLSLARTRGLPHISSLPHCLSSKSGGMPNKKWGLRSKKPASVSRAFQDDCRP